MKAVARETGGERLLVAVFDKGDEVIAGLEALARKEGIDGAGLTAIGAFRRATVGWFDRERMDYHRIPVDEQVEVLSLVGDIAVKGGEPKVHAHVVLGRRDGTALGGHLLDGTVWPTLEVVVAETPRALRRRHDEETGLALIDLVGTDSPASGGRDDGGYARVMITDVARGAAAGALGTAALNLVTYLDVAVRGRPPSEVPAKTVGKLADTAHVDLSAGGDEATAAHRRTGIGALSGYATGIAVGALYGAVRAALPRQRLPLAAVGVAGAAMAAGDASSIATGATDPRTWGVKGWLADIVPHAAYGVVTVAALERIDGR